jgi:hypothetical protein
VVRFENVYRLKLVSFMYEIQNSCYKVALGEEEEGMDEEVML